MCLQYMYVFKIELVLENLKRKSLNTCPYKQKLFNTNKQFFTW